MRDVAIMVLGTIGLLTMLWLVLSALFGLSIIVFVTGSMAPTMPTGAAALVQSVPASELRIGDVVTVARPGTGEPVTHRIVRIQGADDVADPRTISLRGDANTFVDSDRYTVTEAPRVIASAPQAGWIVIWLKEPGVTVTMSLLLAAAIAWALWPEPHDAESRIGEEA